MNTQTIDLVIIGAGPASMAAALSARQNGIKNILVLERGDKEGGILNQCIHNGFGLHYFKEELTGPEYALRFKERLEKEGIAVKLNTMVLDITSDKVVTAINKADGVITIQAKAIVLGMGCRERTRGALNIPGTRPAGVLTAGSAQLFINMQGYMPGKEVVILGSGDIGLIMARRMTLEGANVKAVCEIMPYSGGLQRNIVQCLDDFNIPLKLSHTVVQIHGTKRVEGITIAQVDEQFKPIESTYEYIPCDTLLLSVGLIPENELSSKADVTLDPRTSGPAVSEWMETTVEGIFACGNVVHVHDLVDFVTLESEQAGRGASLYIKGELSHTKERMPLQTKTGRGIRYIVPQRIDYNNAPDTIPLSFRTDNTYKNVTLQICVDGKVIKSLHKNHMAPGEMEKFSLPKTTLQPDSQEVTISIE